MKSVLRYNFYASVLACIAAGLALYFMPSLLMPATTDADAETRSMVSTIGLGVAVVQATLWIVSYRLEQGQAAAFAIGAVAVIIGQYIGEHLGADLILTLANLESLSNLGYYVGISHLLYFVIYNQAVMDWLAAFERMRRRS